MIGLDTSVLVRYFAQDDEEQGRLALQLVRQRLTAANPGFVSLVALAELAWVMRSRFKAKRDEIITMVETLLASPTMVVQDADAVWMALDDCTEAGVGVADALIAAIGRLHGSDYTLTFDQQVLRITGMRALV